MTELDLDDRSAAVALLARGRTTDAVGVEIGKSGRTVRRWREDPAFEADVQSARRALLAEAVAAATGAVRDAIDTLHAELKNPSAAIRVRAASELIRTLPALADHAGIEARLEALEAAQAGEGRATVWRAA